MTSLKKQDQVSTTGTISSSTSISQKKVYPSSMQQALGLLKKQIRQLKFQREQIKKLHEQQISSYIKQIESLKKKMIQMNQKQYLKDLMMDQVEEEKMKMKSLQSQVKKMKVTVDKLQSDLKQKEREVYKYQEEAMDLKRKINLIQKQKQKHLELSIIQKLNLQERIQILQKQILSKEYQIHSLHNQSLQLAQKQLQLKKQQKTLTKKHHQLQSYSLQLHSTNQFQKQKLKKRILTLQKENQFFRNYLSTIEKKFNEIQAECVCSNKECRKEVNLFKEKYINKSRELSKVKVELSKELFKEQFGKEVGNRMNVKTDCRKQSCQKVLERAANTGSNNYSHSNLAQSTKKPLTNNNKQDIQNDILLFKLTQDDDEDKYMNFNNKHQSMSLKNSTAKYPADINNLDYTKKRSYQKYERGMSVINETSDKKYEIVNKANTNENRKMVR